MTKPGSCNKGFKSRPSGAAGNKRSNGLEVVKMNIKKPVETKPKIPMTRATMAKGKLRENNATATVQPDNIKTHNNKEPSWPPHTDANLYCEGNKELECSAMYLIEKSSVSAPLANTPKENAMSKNCSTAAGFARACQR